MSTSRNRASGQVRIISGIWRGRKLPVVYAEGLRPTTDRTKETLFNWLMADIRSARCLDAFAGSGSLGFEALSRGAKEVVFVEKDKLAAKTLSNNAKTLGINASVVCSDSTAYLQQQSEPFDLVFIDPPFQCGLVEPILKVLLNKQRLNNNALVYIEHEAKLKLERYPELTLLKEKSTAQFRYALYKYVPN